jgi:hypothetical protein
MPAGILTDWHSVQFFCTPEISPTSCPKWHLDTLVLRVLRLPWLCHFSRIFCREPWERFRRWFWAVPDRFSFLWMICDFCRLCTWK